MDPTACLIEIRRLVTEINESPADDRADLALDLAEHVAALDEWITKGGFRPTQWAVPVCAKRRRVLAHPPNRRN
jgi:hypothetical protein